MFNIEEASKYLGVSKSTLRKWEKDGKIKSLKTMGKHRRYEKEYLDDFKKRNYENCQKD